MGVYVYIMILNNDSNTPLKPSVVVVGVPLNLVADTEGRKRGQERE
jgi:hypothetical protein